MLRQRAIEWSVESTFSEVGLEKVLDRIETFQKGYMGQMWKPAPLLVRLAKAGKKFNE